MKKAGRTLVIPKTKVEIAFLTSTGNTPFEKACRSLGSAFGNRIYTKIPKRITPNSVHNPPLKTDVINFEIQYFIRLVREIVQRIFPLFFSAAKESTNGNEAVMGSSIDEYPENAFLMIIGGKKSLCDAIKPRSNVSRASNAEYAFPFVLSEKTCTEKHNTAVMMIAAVKPRFEMIRARSHFNILSTFLPMDIHINLSAAHIYKSVVQPTVVLH